MFSCHNKEKKERICQKKHLKNREALEIRAGSLYHFSGEPDRGEPTFHQ